MATVFSARAAWEENKLRAIAAINALAYADDAFELTADNAKALRALAAIMPDDAANALDDAASDMEADAKAESDLDAAFWIEANYRYDEARGSSQVWL